MGKRATNVSISAEVLEEAMREGINLSQTLETRLLEMLQERRRDRWVAENRNAIDSFNAHVERNGGSFGDDYRTF